MGTEALEVMRQGREAMRLQCEEVAKLIMGEARVKSHSYHDRGLHGWSFPKTGHIHAPKPTTRRRLYIVAHECAHVALNHERGGGKPVHRIEYEAERWAIEAMRRHGVAVPRKSLLNAKRHVARKIEQAKRRGAKSIDREALRWSEI